MLDGLPLVPDGTTIPPLPYLVAVLLAAGSVAVAVRRQRPNVTGRHVLALVPWIALGAAFHVLFVVAALPPFVAPLGGSPTVYLVVGTLAAAVWVVADAAASTDRRATATAVGGTGGDSGSAEVGERRADDSLVAPDRVPGVLAVAGTVLLVPTLVAAGASGVSTAGAGWSAVALVLSVPVTGAVWWAIERISPEAGVTGGVGVLAVAGHALDGVSTAIGVTQLGFGERTPLSRAILELGGLPAVPVLGEGWAFLLVKLAVASVLVHLFGPYVREEPGEGLLLLGFVAAVGLGPAVHNLVLFSVAA